MDWFGGRNPESGHYPRIDEMAGMQVSVTRTAGAGPITFETGVDKAYSIERWRQELDNSR